MNERVRAWVKPRKKWLIPLICLLLGSLFGGSFSFVPQEEKPVEIEVWVEDG